MKNKFLEKASSRITAEQRALMVKSLEIISQIHAILERKDITQKILADMLEISQAGVSKMLSPGGNLGLNTIVRLELLFGETIVFTPQKAAAIVQQKTDEWTLPIINTEKQEWRKINYETADKAFFMPVPQNSN